MAGCFGNNFWDRNMESQLFRYLDQCDDITNFIEEIENQFSNEFWEIKEIDDWIFDDEKLYEKWLNKLYERRFRYNDMPEYVKHCAKVIERAYKLFKIEKSCQYQCGQQ